MDAAIRNVVDVDPGYWSRNFKVTHPLYESQLERKVLGEETLARKVITITFNMRSNLVYLDFWLALGGGCRGV